MCGVMGRVDHKHEVRFPGETTAARDLGCGRNQLFGRTRWSRRAGPLALTAKGDASRRRLRRRWRGAVQASPYDGRPDTTGPLSYQPIVLLRCPLACVHLIATMSFSANGKILPDIFGS